MLSISSKWLLQVAQSGSEHASWLLLSSEIEEVRNNCLQQVDEMIEREDHENSNGKF
jgi:hypothetical protein